MRVLSSDLIGRELRTDLGGLVDRSLLNSGFRNPGRTGTTLQVAGVFAGEGKTVARLVKQGLTFSHSVSHPESTV
jgi:hypothetical protein